MLPKKYRLHQDKEIKDLVKSGRTFFLPEMTIKYKTNQAGNVRIGFIVSSRVDKRAVVRNKVVRRLREIMRSFLPQLKDGYFMLIIAKKKLSTLEFEMVQKQLLFALDKIGAFNKK